MKKVFSVFMFSVLVFAGCSESKEDYAKRVKVTSDSLASYGSLSISMGALISENWSGAIQSPLNKLDENNKPIPVGYDGKPYAPGTAPEFPQAYLKEDFNDAITRTLKTYSKVTETISKQKSSLDSMMKSVNTPPTGAENVHKQLLDMYGIYTQTVEAATSPSGSLINYNRSLNEMSSELKKKQNELNTMLPN